MMSAVSDNSVVVVSAEPTPSASIVTPSAPPPSAPSAPPPSAPTPSHPAVRQPRVRPSASAPLVARLPWWRRFLCSCAIRKHLIIVEIPSAERVPLQKDVKAPRDTHDRVDILGSGGGEGDENERWISVGHGRIGVGSTASKALFSMNDGQNGATIKFKFINTGKGPIIVLRSQKRVLRGGFCGVLNATTYVGHVSSFEEAFALESLRNVLETAKTVVFVNETGGVVAFGSRPAALKLVDKQKHVYSVFRSTKSHGSFAIVNVATGNCEAITQEPTKAIAEIYKAP